MHSAQRHQPQRRGRISLVRNERDGASRRVDERATRDKDEDLTAWLRLPRQPFFEDFDEVIFQRMFVSKQLDVTRWNAAELLEVVSHHLRIMRSKRDR